MPPCYCMRRSNALIDLWERDLGKMSIGAESILLSENENMEVCISQEFIFLYTFMWHLSYELGMAPDVHNMPVSLVYITLL